MKILQNRRFCFHFHMENKPDEMPVFSILYNIEGLPNHNYYYTLKEETVIAQLLERWVQIAALNRSRHGQEMEFQV